MKKSTLIIIALAILILLSLVVYLYLADKLPFFANQISKEMPPSKQTPVATTTNSSTSKLKTYRNEKFGFEFQYPSDWSLHTNVFSSPFSKFNLIGTTPKEKVPNTIIPSLLVNIVTADFADRSFSDLRDTASSVVISGVKGLKYEYEFANQPRITIDIPFGEYRILLGGSKKYEDILNEIFASFRFLNQTGSMKLYRNEEWGLRGVASISLNLASPAELLVTDPQGRKLGKDPINNIEYNEIPGGSYYQEGIGNPFPEIPTATKESKFIWIPHPLDGQYDIQVIGTETENYKMELLAYDQKGESKDVIHKGDIAPNIVQEFELNYSKENIQEAEIYRIVNIDIKPGSYPNSINLKSKGLIPVAVLTDQFFNAETL